MVTITTMLMPIRNCNLICGFKEMFLVDWTVSLGKIVFKIFFKWNILFYLGPLGAALDNYLGGNPNPTYAQAVGIPRGGGYGYPQYGGSFGYYR